MVGCGEFGLSSELSSHYTSQDPLPGRPSRRVGHDRNSYGAWKAGRSGCPQGWKAGAGPSEEHACCHRPEDQACQALIEVWEGACPVVATAGTDASALRGGGTPGRGRSDLELRARGPTRPAQASGRRIPAVGGASRWGVLLDRKSRCGGHAEVDQRDGWASSDFGLA